MVGKTKQNLSWDLFTNYIQNGFFLIIFTAVVLLSNYKSDFKYFRMYLCLICSVFSVHRFMMNGSVYLIYLPSLGFTIFFLFLSCSLLFSNISHLSLSDTMFPLKTLSAHQNLTSSWHCFIQVHTWLFSILYEKAYVMVAMFTWI